MSSFTKQGLSLNEGDKVKWDGLPALVVAVAEEDTECPYRVFSEGHEVSGWVSGEVLELVEAAKYEAPAPNMLRVGDFVSTPEGKGVVLVVDFSAAEPKYFVGIFGIGSDDWEVARKVTFISRPDYGEVV
ncbi:MAG: hypothetical protein A2Y38_03330 [Spirochaetes bacterium GWB1_59_5]|nr:MAG: hypothetical protein A2Y38_03330 [Spirochaetes bacterium GWB1_59_5]